MNRPPPLVDAVTDMNVVVDINVVVVVDINVVVVVDIMVVVVVMDVNAVVVAIAVVILNVVAAVAAGPWARCPASGVLSGGEAFRLGDRGAHCRPQGASP